MADAVAGQLSTAAAHLPDGLLRLKLGKTKLNTTLHSLKLENVMNEIIPLHQWHFLTDDENKTPVLNDLRDYQDRASLKTMTETRDTNNTEQRWSSTALSFASKIHPRKIHHFGPLLVVLLLFMTGLDMVATVANNAISTLHRERKSRDAHTAPNLIIKYTACYSARTRPSMHCAQLLKTAKL
jgi:hypothetical protein